MDCRSTRGEKLTDDRRCRRRFKIRFRPLAAIRVRADAHVTKAVDPELRLPAERALLGAIQPEMWIVENRPHGSKRKEFAVLAIKTRHLTKRFAGHVAVDAVELRVPTGCVYGFLGPNGAGKTTTMRLLLGLMAPDAGSVTLVGHDLATARRAALTQVGAFVESPSLYDHLSGWTNLDLTRRLRGLPFSEIDRVLEVVDLRNAGDKKVGSYSLGMKQRLAIARAIMGTPKLLLLDEPTNGLDPDGTL
jgi:ABC-type uncharacterized transport system ATPase subunit